MIGNWRNQGKTRLAHLPNRIASSFAAAADIRVNTFLKFDFDYILYKCETHS